MKTKLPYLAITFVVVVLDQITKRIVESKLAGGPPVEVIPGLLNFTHTRNSGVAFGLFATHGNPLGTALLTFLGVAALVVVGLYFWRTADGDRRLLVALALILGGAVGNLADRVLSGAVTDFVDFYFGTYHWHTFNVADTAITIGIGLMLLDVFWPRAQASVSEEPTTV